MLSPGFFQNEILIELHPLTRLLFAGLWTIADREGRLEDRPKRIKMALLPADDHDVDTALTDLHHAGFITRYATRDGNYIQINKFLRHQKPHIREAASEIPPPTATQGTGEHDLGSPKASLGTPDMTGHVEEGTPRLPVSVSVSTSVPVSNAVARAPKQAGRIFLHRWQMEALINTLGPHADDFALDEWLDDLSRSAAVLPKDRWAWVQAQLEAEVRRRGLPVEAAASSPVAGKQTTRLASALANIKAQERIQ